MRRLSLSRISFRDPNLNHNLNPNLKIIRSPGRFPHRRARVVEFNFLLQRRGQRIAFLLQRQCQAAPGRGRCQAVTSCLRVSRRQGVQERRIAIPAQLAGLRGQRDGSGAVAQGRVGVVASNHARLFRT